MRGLLDGLLTQKRFRATLGDRTYTDRLAYEQAVKGLIDGADPRRIKVGLDVCFNAAPMPQKRRQPRAVSMTWGQVWSAAPGRGHWWIRSDDGRTFEWSRAGCRQVDSRGVTVKASA